jgi:hypothetical protein
MSKARLKTLTASVLDLIEDRFEEGDGGEMLLTSPLDDESTFDLYQRDNTDAWDIVIGDDSSDTNPRRLNLPTLDAAKARVAEMIAEQIIAAEGMLATAKKLRLIAA